MSSILDALNKLEGEKERERARQELDPRDIDPASAAVELIEPDALRDSVTLNVRPLTLVVGGLTTILIVIVIVMMTVSFMTKSTPPQTIASVPATPVTEPPQQQPVAAVSSEPVETIVEIPEAASAPTPTPEPSPVIIEAVSTPLQPQVAPTEVPKSDAAEPPQEHIEPEPVAPTPAPKEVVQEAAPVKTEPIAPDPEPERIESAPPAPVIQDRTAIAKVEAPRLEAPAPTPERRPRSIPKALQRTVVEAPADTLTNIQTLPRFTLALQRKHGFDNFKINMINPASDANPYGNAIINREKVFEDSFIGGNQVKLIKVTRQGIALEVVRSGDRYFHGF